MAAAAQLNCPTSTTQEQLVLARRSAGAPLECTSAAASSSRYQSLDLWRGVACLMLVVYHATSFVHGTFDRSDPASWSVANVAVEAAHLLWVGVPMFFVVSGYCIAASVQSLQRRPYSLTTFFTRRLRRIYPPLWAGYVLAIALTLAVAGMSPKLYEHCRQLPRLSEFSFANWVSNLSASQSWLHHATRDGSSYLMNNTWTLCFEEQFYLVVGVLLAVAARRFYWGAVIVTVLTLLARHGCRLVGVSLDGIFVEGHWLMFATGILLFYQLNHASPLGQKLIFAGLGLGVIYAIADRACWAPSPRDRHLDGYLLIACAFASALSGLRVWDQQLNAAKLVQPFFWCGKWSYSIYLTHYPVVIALAGALDLAGLQTPSLWLMVVLPLCLAVSLGCGWTFHQVVERHFLNAAIGQSNRNSRMVGSVDSTPSVRSRYLRTIRGFTPF